MAKGSFVVSQDQKDARDIRFDLDPKAPDPKPEEQLLLKDEIDGTLRVLQLLYPAGDKRYEQYYRPLLSLAQAGLAGDHADPISGRRALASLRLEIIGIEAGRVKNTYMKLLGATAAILAAGALVVALIAWCYAMRNLAGFLILWTGTMGGVWLSFGVRKAVFEFEDLITPEKDRVEPIVRLVFTGLLSVIVGLIFSLKMVTVTLGAMSTASFPADCQLALLIGFLCGFSETALPATVAEQATRLLDISKK